MKGDELIEGQKYVFANKEDFENLCFQNSNVRKALRKKNQNFIYFVNTTPDGRVIVSDEEDADQLRCMFSFLPSTDFLPYEEPVPEP